MGRVTKYGIEACLGRLYMFRGKYDDALEVLGDVINNGGYQLADTYEDCFSELYDNDKTRDRLWEVQFLNGVEGEGQELFRNLYAGKL